MQKYLIGTAVVFVLVIGLWTWCCMAGPPWLSGFTKGVTQGAANAMGIHMFDQPKAGAGADEPKKETVANLPDGYYVYVGQRPAQSAPRWVVVNPGGTISWLNSGAAVAPTPAQPTSSAPATAVKPAAPGNAGDGQFDEYNYPKIKWKAKPLADGAIAQLWTTYEQGSQGVPGTVKYRLTVFKAVGNSSHEVQLLDGSGFKLVQFNAGDFHQIPDSQLMEARDSFQCDENEYRQARDYSIN